LAVQYFRQVLEPRHFTISTGHNPLVLAFQQRDMCSPRQFNQLDFIPQFTTNIWHIFGRDNIITDALSRVEVFTAPIPQDDKPSAQDECDELQTLLESDTALQLTKLLIPSTSVQLYGDTSSGTPVLTSPLLSVVKFSNLSIPSAILV
jgi:hypothetical protein